MASRRADVGLVGSGWVLDAGFSYGTVMLTLMIFPIIASVIVWFRYPETAHLELEEISIEANKP